ncbi:MAG: 1,4-alpha-glucan branching protein GlgB [Saprospiraceae bacterium]|nr:1,4-alpha-glucan branching protein GlgB [Saprospiraceae bacterium]
MANKVIPHTFFSEFDISLFQTGKHFRLYEKFGAHLCNVEGSEGTYFAVFAPTAANVQVVGDFNGWNGEEHNLNIRWDTSGIWEGFIPSIGEGDLYKFQITTADEQRILVKTDPFGFYQEVAPKTASIVWQHDFKWKDKAWMKKRKKHNDLSAPFAIYEVHPTSWKIHPDGRLYSYDDLIEHLVPYVGEMGFTHVELMPVMEHPFGGSWGYQVTGFYAPTSRQGDPDGLKRLINAFHQNNIGVILDWVPSHFPSDGHGLATFDGSCVYEHPDPQKGYHPDWKSHVFNYERPEVRAFLISNALFWLDYFHVDGLRVDAVASIIHLDYSREEGEWTPNQYGGNYYLEAIDFVKDFNAAVYGHYPDTQTIAEESTTFPMVTQPVHLGGLGFGMKWMMGWMNDTLEYFKVDPFFRRYEHGKLSFSLVYVYSENYVLPLSHDEIVHGKSPMLYKMPGDEWQKFANVRLLYGYMFTHPGNKLLFMGNEFGQTNEWNYEEELAWGLLQYEVHEKLQRFVKDLNHFFRDQKALYEMQYNRSGFEWIDQLDDVQSVLIYLRKGKKSKDQMLVVCNFTPETREKYSMGIPAKGKWKIALNSDDKKYGGSGFLKGKTFKTSNKSCHGREQSLVLDLPPLAMVALSYQG